MPIIALFLSLYHLILNKLSYSNSAFRGLGGFFLLLLPLFASPQQLMKVRTFNIHNGLPSNYVTQVSQAPDGVVWIATWNGLAYFDGYRFVNFRDNDGKMASHRIFTVRPGADGVVWMLTYDKRPFMLNARTGQFTDVAEITGMPFNANWIYTEGNVTWIIGDSITSRIELKPGADPDVQMLTDGVRRVAFDSEGREWVMRAENISLHGTSVTKDGKFANIVELDGEVYAVNHGGNIYRGENLDDMNTGLKLVGIFDAKPYRGWIAMASRGGIYAYNPKSKEVKQLSDHISGASLYTDSQQRLWAIADDSRVYMMPDIKAAFIEIDVAPTTHLTTKSTRNVWLEDDYGTVWVGAANRPFGYFDPEQGKIVPNAIESRLLGNSAIPKIEVALVDDQNNLWVSSMHNLSLVNFCNRNLRFVPAKSDTETRSATRTPDGHVWLGTTDGMLCSFTPQGQLSGYITEVGGRIATSPTPAKFADRIYALLTDSKGNVWIGTKGFGAYVVAPDGTVMHYTQDADDRNSLPDNNIYDFDEDNAGNIWIATYGGGVAKVAADDNTPERRRFISRNNGFSAYPADKFHRVRRVTHTPDNVMIASTTDGLITFDGRVAAPSKVKFFTTVHDAADKQSLRSSHVMHTLATSDGSVYVAPLGECLQKVSGKNLLTDQLKFEPLSSSNGLHPFLRTTTKAGNVISMVEGPHGMLYIVLESCIVAYSPATGNTASIGYNDFDNSIEFTEAKALIDPKTHTLWAPSTGGAYIVDPEKMAVSTFVPNIVVTGKLPDTDDTYAIHGKRIVLPAGTNSLSLWMAALDYSNNELIQYAYRLDNQPDWNYVGSTNSLNLTGLSPGKHNLCIKSTNGDGVWTDNDTCIEIYATPTFWQSIWGRLLIVLLIVALAAAVVYGIYMWRKHPIANIIARRKIMQSSLLNEISTKVLPTEEASDENAPDGENAEDVTLTKADREMLKRLTEYIEEHIGDENLRVESMAEAMNMSRTVFFGKIKALVGLAPSDFVRNLRMQRAKKLMSETDLTISEIAYQVGYSDPKYFTKCFKKDIGVTPKEFRKGVSDN